MHNLGCWAEACLCQHGELDQNSLRSPRYALLSLQLSPRKSKLLDFLQCFHFLLRRVTNTYKVVFNSKVILNDGCLNERDDISKMKVILPRQTKHQDLFCTSAAKRSEHWLVALASAFPGRKIMTYMKGTYSTKVSVNATHQSTDNCVVR